MRGETLPRRLDMKAARPLGNLTWLAPGRLCPLCCGGFWCRSSWLVDNRTDCGRTDACVMRHSTFLLWFHVVGGGVGTVPPVGGVVSSDVSWSIAAGGRTPEAQNTGVNHHHWRSARSMSRDLLFCTRSGLRFGACSVVLTAALQYIDFVDSLEFLCVGRHHPADVLVGQLAAWQPAGGKETQTTINTSARVWNL